MAELSDVLDKITNLETALKCSVCDNILKDPVLLVMCGHSVCKQCSPGNLECPVCETHSRYIEDTQLQELLSNLESLKQLLDGKTPEITGNKKTPCSSAGSVVMVPSVSSTTPQKVYLLRPRKSRENAEEEDSEDKLPRKNRKRCGECPGCLQKQNCGRCGPCQSRHSHMICKMRNCEQLKTKKEKVPSVSSTTPQKVYLLRARRSIEYAEEFRDFPEDSEDKGSPDIQKNPVLAAKAVILNKKNHKGETQLHRAVIKGDIYKVRELLAAGATVNIQDNDGWTPLHEASSHGHIAIATLLLDHGALVNVPSYSNYITPLHDALVNGKLEIAKLLVEKGADMHARTSDGFSALSIVEDEKDKTMLIEACSPFIQAQTHEPTKSDGKIVFLAAVLNEDQQDKLQKCAKLLDADIVEEFKPEVTHIVTPCDVSGNCTRTMKILLGIITGKWLMNYEWVEVCLLYKRQVEEEILEVQGTESQPNSMGPKIARHNYFKKLPPLFKGFHFYLQGPFSRPVRSELMCLVKAGGGNVLSREPRVANPSDVVMPYHADGTVFQTVDTVVITAHKSEDGKSWTGNITTRPVSWLIACISGFKILDQVDDHGNEWL